MPWISGLRFCKDRKIKYDECADGVGRLAALVGTPEFRAARTTIVRADPGVCGQSAAAAEFRNHPRTAWPLEESSAMNFESILNFNTNFRIIA